MRVELSNVGHRFAGGDWLFRNITVGLDGGEVYSLTGPSGSGKSTFLSLLAGWLEPAEGTVSHSDGRRVAWVFQNPHGSPLRSARDHVALPIAARGLSPRDADAEAERTLARVGLAHLADRSFRDLSGGEAQRLMLARALAARPRLLLIDEPTAQLDPATAETVNAVLSSLAADGTVAVVATHDPQTRDACTRHIVLAAPSGPSRGEVEG